ncbi:hypothetical protein [Longivirga aurantiaca]|uniref:Uncharacterized protein n=1 Tax=Longivirga aurantiaca TaxID=1837743 RepID=A0ABW1T326_9ACTN
MSGLRRRLVLAAVVFGLLGILAFAVLSATTFNAISDIPDIDPETGEIIRSSRSAITDVLLAGTPVLGVISIALCILCGAGVVASFVADGVLDRSAALRAQPAREDDGLSDPELLQG